MGDTARVGPRVEDFDLSMQAVLVHSGCMFCRSRQAYKLHARAAGVQAGRRRVRPPPTCRAAMVQGWSAAHRERPAAWATASPYRRRLAATRSGPEAARRSSCPRGRRVARRHRIGPRNHRARPITRSPRARPGRDGARRPTVEVPLTALLTSAASTSDSRGERPPSRRRSSLSPRP